MKAIQHLAGGGRTGGEGRERFSTRTDACHIRIRMNGPSTCIYYTCTHHSHACMHTDTHLHTVQPHGVVIHEVSTQVPRYLIDSNILPQFTLGLNCDHLQHRGRWQHRKTM